MSTENESDGMKRPERPRAIFSKADFPLLKTAVAHYAHTCEDPAEASRYANLLHRLGRAD